MRSSIDLTGWVVICMFASGQGCTTPSPSGPEPPASTRLRPDAESVSSALPSGAGRDGSALELAQSFGVELLPAAEDGIPVRVVDGTTGNSIVDALVVIVDEEEFFREYGHPGATDRDAVTQLRSIGKAYATGDDGRTRVAPSNRPLSVFAWHDERFGRSTLEVYDRVEHVIPLARRKLRVEVVDAAGKPQPGIPLALGRHIDPPGDSGVWRGVTSTDGRAAIAPLDLERDVHSGCGRRTVITFGFPSRAFAVRAIDEPVLEPVHLVLPECGELLVELQDLEGRLLREDAVVVLDAYEPEEVCGLDRTAAWQNRTRCLFFVSTEGRLYVPRVEIGLDLSVGVFDCQDEFESVTIQGPTKAGERKEVVLRAMPARESVSPGHGRESQSLVEAHRREKASKPRSSVEISVIVDERIEPHWLLSVGGWDDPEYPELMKVGDSTVSYPRTCWFDARGRMSVRGVPAGRHNFTISVNDETQDDPPVLWEVRDVDVGLCEHVRDPRLLNVDLRGKLSRHVLDISDEQGHPLSGHLEILDAAQSGFLEFSSGHHELVTTAGREFRVRVLVPRFRPVERNLTADPARNQIELKRGLPVRVVLDPDFKMPAEPPLKIYVGVPEDPGNFAYSPEGLGEADSGEGTLRTVEVRPGGSASFDIPLPGNWRVYFTIGRSDRTDSDAGPEHKSMSASEPIIRVVDSEQEQVFIVSPDSEEWVQALENLAGQE